MQEHQKDGIEYNESVLNQHKYDNMLIFIVQINSVFCLKRSYALKTKKNGNILQN